jgi:hypothetical protein
VSWHARCSPHFNTNPKGLSFINQVCRYCRFAMHSNARNTKRRQKVQSWWPQKRKRGGRILDHVDTWPREKCETLHGVLRPAEASPRRHEDAANGQATRRSCTQRALCFLSPFVFSAEEDFFFREIKSTIVILTVARCTHLLASSLSVCTYGN